MLTTLITSNFTHWVCPHCATRYWTHSETAYRTEARCHECGARHNHYISQTYYLVDYRPALLQVLLAVPRALYRLYVFTKMVFISVVGTKEDWRRVREHVLPPIKDSSGSLFLSNSAGNLSLTDRERR